MFARPGLPSFDYVRATAAAQVVELLGEHGPAARLLMGGTDLLPGLREGRIRPRLVVDVKAVPGLREILYSPGGGLAVGAAVTMNELARHPEVQAHYPLLALAAGAVASYQIRNRATAGGNLCNASPCADLGPAALVLEAGLALEGPDGARRLPAAESLRLAVDAGGTFAYGSNFGKVKAMYNERNQLITEAGPSAPVLMIGLNGAPQAGDSFNVMLDEREAKNIATKRMQLQREQGIRTQKHITLDEIGRRIAIGNFQELNIIVKGDVDGSVEALSDSLIKLSTPEIQLNIIHKAVGQISESDILLAAASNAIIVGFQVRPSLSARKLAEKEEIDIRLYSIIYNAIEEIRSAMEGMLSPEVKEEIVATLEIREIFKVTKVGTVAGCYVKEGKITRNTKVRIIRDGIVIYTGELGSLKRFKDDVKEVVGGYECGLNIANFNDIKNGDIIEGYQQVEIKKTL